MYNHFLGEPDSFTQHLDQFRNATAEGVRSAAAQYLKKQNRVEVITMPAKAPRPSQGRAARNRPPRPFRRERTDDHQRATQSVDRCRSASGRPCAACAGTAPPRRPTPPARRAATAGGRRTGERRAGPARRARREPPPPELKFPERAVPGPATRGRRAEALEDARARRGSPCRAGISVFLVERHNLPIVLESLVFEGGSRVDPKGKDGLASVCAGADERGHREAGQARARRGPGRPRLQRQQRRLGRAALRRR